MIEELPPSEQTLDEFELVDKDDCATVSFSSEEQDNNAIVSSAPLLVNINQVLSTGDTPPQPQLTFSEVRSNFRPITSQLLPSDDRSSVFTKQTSEY